MNKRIIILTISFLLSRLLFANTTIDGAITKAAVDITEKCDAKSILAIDDFESPSQAMTLYIREQLADTIFAEDGLLQIVTREHMDKVEKEMKFQNSGVVSEKTILSVAERLGARFVVFGKLEEFNSSYILRVRMLDVKTGAYLFRKTYEFDFSSPVTADTTIYAKWIVVQNDTVDKVEDTNATIETETPTDINTESSVIVDTDNPQTGVGNGIWIWIVLLVVSAGVILAITIKGKNQK